MQSLQSIGRTVLNLPLLFIEGIKRNPKVLLISILAMGVFAGLGAFWNSRKGKVSDQKPNQATDKTQAAAAEALKLKPSQSTDAGSSTSSSVAKFEELMKEEKLEMLLGDRAKIRDIPFCEEIDLEKLQMKSPIEKGLTKSGKPYIAVQVHYSLTQEEIGEMQQEYILQAYVEQPKQNTHVILIRLLPNTWGQKLEDGAHPHFFYIPFSLIYVSERTKGLINKFQSLISGGTCLDPVTEAFSWKLGHLK